MKKILITIGLSLVIVVIGSAQNRDRAKVDERIEARRIAHISNALDFSPSEAQEFWPVYNEYRAKSKAFRQNRKEKSQTKDAPSNIDAMLDLEQDQLNLKKDYASKFERILGPERTIKLFKSVRAFNERLIKGVKQNRNKKFRQGRSGR